MVGRWGMVVDRGVIGGGGVVDRGVVRSRGGGVVDSLPLIGYISDKPPVVVSMVGNVLGAAIRQQDGVGPLHVPVSIRDLASIEVCSMIVIVHTILVLVRAWFLKISVEKRNIKIFLRTSLYTGAGAAW